MNKKKSQETREHGDQAINLLKTSAAIHEAEKQGLIPESEATEAAIKLNKKAVAEMDKAIESQKEFIADQHAEIDKS